MSNIIDRRIVEMQFDNKDFEKNIKNSTESLEVLKKSLNLEESAKSLKSFENTGKKLNLSAISEAAEAITEKFSILGTIGDQVFRRIGDAAFNALNKMKSFIDSLTIQPIMSGKQEYETQINAIQTILSNTRDAMTKQGLSDAERLEIVNEKLDQLNHYADKTIYNFTEMTRNIGTFTAAGVELDTAVDSIQGIANLAAVSGSNSEQASRAMYQLSQAISTGTVKLMDWNSVVNAGMGGELFQKALKRTAKAMGITVDEAKSFRDSLSDGWLTSDVLTATLEQFSWDFEQMAEDALLSGRDKESFIQELTDMYIGRGEDADKALEKAKELLKDSEDFALEASKELKKGELLSMGYTPEEAEEIIQLAQDATDAATKVKTFTQLFDTLKEAAQSGWTQTWEYIIGNFDEAKETLTGISDFFGKVIGDSADARNQIMKDWHDAGGRDMIWNNDEEKGPLGAFWNLTYGLQNLIKMVKEEFGKIIPPATGQMLLNFTQKIQQVTAGFKAWTEDSEKMDKIRKILSGITSAFEIVKITVGRVWDTVKNVFGLHFDTILDAIIDFAAGIGDWIVQMKDAVKNSKGFQTFLEKIKELMVLVRDSAAGAAKTVVSWLRKLFAKLKDSKIFTKIGNGINDFIGKIPNAVKKIKEWAKTIIEYAKSSEKFQSAWTNVKSFFETVVSKIIEFGKRLNEAVSAFFNEDTSGESDLGERIKKRFSAFGKSFSDWYSSIKESVIAIWDRITEFFKTFFTITIPKFFESKNISLSAISDKIASLDWGKIIKIVLGVGSLIKVFSVVQNVSKIGKISDSLKNITETIKDIAKNGASLTKEGLFINGKKKNPLSDTLIKVAAAIGILVGSIYLLAKMDTASIIKGVGVLAFVAGELLLISFLFNKINLDGGTVLKTSLAILLLVVPIKLLSSMPIEQALKGILLLGVVFTELALFSRMAARNFNGKQVGFVAMAFAIDLLTLAVKGLSKISVGGLLKGLVALELMFLEIASFTRLADGKKISGMISMALGVYLLVLSVQKIGKLNIKQIVKGLGGLGGIMLAFGEMVKLSGGMNFKTALVLLLSMAGSMIIFIEAFKQVENFDSANMLSFSASFSALIISLSTALSILSKIPIVGALTGVANLLILITILGAFITGLGWLSSKWKEMSGFLESGGDILGLIGQAIGKFIGGIGSGIVTGLNLPQVGTELSDFMKNANGFIEGIKNIDTSSAAKVGNLTAAIIAISGSEFVAAIVSLFTGENPISKFSKDILKLGAGLTAYALAVAPMALVPQSTLDRSVSVASTLADVVSKIKPSGGIFTVLSGIGSTSTFVEDIGTMAEGIKAFASSASGIDSKDFDQAKIDAVISIASGLATLESSLEAQGGLQDAIEGVKSLSNFGEEMEPFAGGVNSFITQAKSIVYDPKSDNEKIYAIIDIATALSTLQSSLEAQGGLQDAIEGVKSLSNFGEEMEPFAGGVNSFITQAKAIKYDPSTDDEKLKAIVAVASVVAEFEKTIEAQGGMADFFVGSRNLGTFASNIKLFGEAINSYYTNTQGVVIEDGQNAIDSVTLIKEFAESLDPSGGAWDVITKAFGEGDRFTTLLSYAESMKEFGLAIKVFSDSTNGLVVPDMGPVKTLYQGFSDFVDTLDPSGGVANSLWNGLGNGDKITTLNQIADSMYKFGEGMKSFSAGSSSSVNALLQMDHITQLFDAFVIFSNYMKETGGVKDDVDISGIQAMLDSIAQLSIPEFDIEGIDAAKTFLNGLTTGLGSESSTGGISSAVENLSGSGTTAANNTYKSWYESGKYLASGLSRGIVSLFDKIRTAAAIVATVAVNSIRTVWNEHSPSKVGEDLGMNFDLGISSGLNSYSKIVSDKAAEVGKSVIDSASTMLDGANGSIFDNLDPNPTIRPVMDLTNIQNGVSSINGMMQSSSLSPIGLFRGMNLSRGIDQLRLDGGKITGTFTDKNILSKLSGLEEKFELLGKSVSGMKIVLDTGTLVGETSSQMDDQLGTIAMRRGRGN